MQAPRRPGPNCALNRVSGRAGRADGEAPRARDVAQRSRAPRARPNGNATHGELQDTPDHEVAGRPEHERTPFQIGGGLPTLRMGASAGVGILLHASIPSHALAIACLGVFALCTALSMTLLSTGFGLTLDRPAVRRSFTRLVPVLGHCKPRVRRLVLAWRAAHGAVRFLSGEDRRPVRLLAL